MGRYSSGFHNGRGNGIPTLETIKACRARLRDVVGKAGGRTAMRPVVKPPNVPHPSWRSVPYEGPLIDMCLCEDAHLAKLLSWDLGRKKMEAVIVTTREDRKWLTDRNAPVYLITQVSRFSLGGVGRGRSEEDKIRGRLPIPEPRDSRGRRPEGFVDFAVNLIKLAPHHEHYRETVLWDALRDKLVFRTQTEGDNYVEYCVRHGRRKQAFLALDTGFRCQSSGPSSRDDYLPERVDHIMGWRDLETDHRAEDGQKLEAVERAVEEVEEVEARLRGIESDGGSRERSSQIQRLNEEIRGLQVSAQPAGSHSSSSRGGSSRQASL